MITKTVDIFPIRIGRALNSGTLGNWVNQANALVIDGSYATTVSSAAGGSGDSHFVFETSLPRNATVAAIELHIVAALTLPQTVDKPSIRAYRFDSQAASSPGDSVRRFYFDTNQMTLKVIPVHENLVAFFNDNPGAIQYFSMLVSAPKDTYTDLADQLNIDGFFLRVTYTYDEENQQPNLVRNGFGEEESNANFSVFTFDRSDALPGTRGSFRLPGGTGNVFLTSDMIPVNPDKWYAAGAAVKSFGATRIYLGLDCLDIDGLRISTAHVKWQPNTLTTLAQPLRKGDTKIFLTSAANWHNGANQLARSVVVWDYRDSTGYLYPPETYSRIATIDAYAEGGIAGNVITLRTGWGFNDAPAGTPISNGNPGASYVYAVASGAAIDSTWRRYEGRIGGVNLSGTDILSAFRPATRHVRWLIWADFDKTGFETLLSSVYFGEVPVREIDSILPVTANLQAAIVRAAHPEADLFSNANLNADLVRAQLIAAGLEVTGNLQADLTRAQLLAAGLTVEGRLTAELFRVLPEIRDPHFVIHPNNPKLTVS